VHLVGFIIRNLSHTVTGTSNW